MAYLYHSIRHQPTLNSCRIGEGHNDDQGVDVNNNVHKSEKGGSKVRPFEKNKNEAIHLPLHLSMGLSAEPPLASLQEQTPNNLEHKQKRKQHAHSEAAIVRAERDNTGYDFFEGEVVLSDDYKVIFRRRRA